MFSVTSPWWCGALPCYQGLGWTWPRKQTGVKSWDDLLSHFASYICEERYVSKWTILAHSRSNSHSAIHVESAHKKTYKLVSFLEKKNLTFFQVVRLHSLGSQFFKFPLASPCNIQENLTKPKLKLSIWHYEASAYKALGVLNPHTNCKQNDNLSF